MKKSTESYIFLSFVFILVAIIITFIIGVSFESCRMNSKNSNNIKIDYYHANYMIDDRTGLCYSSYNGSATYVPCTTEVLKLINNR